MVEELWKTDQGREDQPALGQDQLATVRGQPGPAKDGGSALQPPPYGNSTFGVKKFLNRAVVV
jgi:hypothetical protein